MASILPTNENLEAKFKIKPKENQNISNCALHLYTIQLMQKID